VVRRNHPWRAQLGHIGNDPLPQEFARKIFLGLQGICFRTSIVNKPAQEVRFAAESFRWQPRNHERHDDDQADGQPDHGQHNLRGHQHHLLPELIERTKPDGLVDDRDAERQGDEKEVPPIVECADGMDEGDVGH
jgi:hypothetical protein